jgi:serine/threonine-protein kinase
VATALVDRGEAASALRVLARADSCAAFMVRADVLASGGDLASAIVLAERALLRDIDWPGARERHARWRAALGQAPPRKMDATTTMVTSRPEAPFRLLREIGRGGAVTVYEAEDPDLGRHVALKVYHRVDRDRAQLLHEARAAVALAGAGVVRMFDVDPEHGWLVMEWARLGPRAGPRGGMDPQRCQTCERASPRSAYAAAERLRRGEARGGTEPPG